MKYHLLFAGFLLSSAAHAMSVDWAGTYRLEWNQVNRPSMTTPQESKAYGLQYLGLSPKIVASDGVEINGKFDILANQDAAYANTQMGQLWGQGFTSPNSGATTANTNPTTRNTNSQTKPETTLKVSQLYLTVNQEYGSLLAGRAPFEFGTGLLYNAGNGPFDHWSTTMDMVAYKVIVGNLSFMPMIGQVAQDNPAQANTIQDQGFQFMYDAKESNSQLAAIVSRRKGPKEMNDTPVGTAAATNATPRSDVFGQTVTDQYSMQTSSLYFSRGWDSFRFRMEAAFMSGDYGVQTTNGTNVKNNSYGIGLNFEFPRNEGRWDWNVRVGAASGDDPNSADTWEGFYFNRNYDIAMLLFNHRLGDSTRDFLRSNVNKDAGHNNSNSLDDETVSNAMYLSPRMAYGWNDRFDVTGTLTYAQMMANPTAATDPKKDLGLELDLGLTYKPRVNVRWENQLGLLFPGAAYKDGNSSLTNGFVYGFTSRAAITF